MIKTKKQIQVLSLAAAMLLSFFVLGSCKKTVTVRTTSDESDASYADIDESGVQTGDGVSADASKAEGSGGDAAESGSGRTTRARTTQNNSGKPSGKDLVVDGLGNDVNANYNVSGKVVVAIDTARPTDYQGLFDTFQKLYKNVDLEFDYFMHDGSDDNAAQYLTTRSAAGNLPDVVFDEAGSLPVYASQGWLYPLDSFVKNDPDFQYVPSNLVSDYTFKGKLYALPHQAHFEVMLINLDAVDELNLKMPSLDWTMDDFEDFLKKGTTSKYSGIEELWGLPIRLAGSMSTTVGYYGYNSSTRKFDLSPSLGKALTLVRSLREYPGLEAWWMRQSSSGGDSDYVKKFGSSNLSDDHMAYRMGRTLVSYEGTWGYSSLKSTLKFNWEFWPYPQDKSTPGRMPVHIDHSFMTSAAQNPEAAFQLLRYVTYSTEGNLARLSMFDKTNKGVYTLNQELYYPTTTNPRVAEKFNSLSSVGKVEKYLFSNIKNSYRADLFKIVPDFRNVYNQYISPEADKVSDGVKTSGEVMPEAEKKANEAITAAWSTFETKIGQVQSQFSASH